MLQQNTKNIYPEPVNHIAKTIGGLLNAKLLVRTALASLFQAEHTRASQSGSHGFRPGLLSHSRGTNEHILSPHKEEKGSKSLLLSSILGRSGKYMNSWHLLKGTFHFTLGQVSVFVSRLQELALMLN